MQLIRKVYVVHESYLYYRFSARKCGRRHLFIPCLRREAVPQKSVGGQIWDLDVKKWKTKKQRHEALTKQTLSSSLELEKMTGVGREKRAENAAGRPDYHALERRHDADTRARDVAVAQRTEEAAARKPAEKLTLIQEHKLSTDTEECLSLDPEKTLAEKHEQRLRAELETREVQAALAAEEVRRRAEEARVATLREEICRLSLVTEALKEERNELVSVMYDGFGGQLQQY